MQLEKNTVYLAVYETANYSFAAEGDEAERGR
jgi:hypothetical protein